MKKRIDWDRRIGRRIRLRDLNLLFAVVQSGSMMKVAAQMNVSQPAISAAVAALESALGVRLLERSRKGIAPTAYGEVLLKYGRMAMDDLRQAANEIEFLADPTAGELRIACTDTIVNGLLVPIIERLGEQYPKVRLHVDQLATPLYDFPQLEQRKVDLAMVRMNPGLGARISPTVLVEELFTDRYCLVAGAGSPLARRSKVELADLVDQRWITPPADIAPAAVFSPIEAAFVEAGLRPPELAITTFSVFLRATMVASGRYVSILPQSVLRLHRDKLCELRTNLPMPQWPVAAVTLKNREPNPASGLFVSCARDIAASIVRTHAKGPRNARRA